MRMVRNLGPKYLGAAVILVPIAMLALLAPVLPIPEPNVPAPVESLQGPSLEHPFGTDRPRIPDHLRDRPVDL